MDKQDFLLLVVSKFGKSGITPVQLQKSVFLIQKHFPKLLKKKYKFIPYNYGPFDITVYEDTEKLVDKGLLEKRFHSNKGWSELYVTEKGKKKASEIEKNTEKGVSSYVAKLVEWMSGLSFEELVSSIYKQYPKYKTNSIFRDS